MTQPIRDLGQFTIEFHSPRLAHQVQNLMHRKGLTFQDATDKLGLIHGEDFLMMKEDKE